MNDAYSLYENHAEDLSLYMRGLMDEGKRTISGRFV